MRHFTRTYYLYLARIFLYHQISKYFRSDILSYRLSLLHGVVSFFFYSTILGVVLNAIVTS